jgi:hypothetical protein
VEDGVSERMFLPIDFASTESPRREQRLCEAHGCFDPRTGKARITTDYKRFCKDHLDQDPYIKALMDAPFEDEFHGGPREIRCALRNCRRPFTTTMPHQKWCSRACAKKGQRRAEKARKDEARAGAPLKCRGCGKEFAGHPSTRRCYACKSGAHRRNRERRADQREAS